MFIGYLKKGRFEASFSDISPGVWMLCKCLKMQGREAPKAPSGRELPTQSGEGERVSIESH